MTEKKIVLVTGGSRGIGRACSLTLAKQGFHVLIGFRSQEAKAQEVLDQITAEGGTAELCGFDVSDLNQIQEAFVRIGERHKALDGMVLCAGIVKDALLLRMNTDDLHSVFQTNVFGSIWCAKEATRQMLKAKKPASIVFVSSVVGEIGNAGQSLYSATKSALFGFAKSTAREVGSRNIRANVITPGFIETEMTGALSDSQRQALFQQIPLGAFGKPEDVAELACFLIDTRSRYITGQVIGVNGGMNMS